MNKVLITILSLLIFVTFVSAQTDHERIEGEVTYLSSQNIYIKFDNTDNIKVGDTLFLKKKTSLIPAVVIEYLSSRSAAGKKLEGINLKLGNKLSIFYTPTLEVEPEIVIVPLVSEQVVKSQEKKKSPENSSRRIGEVQGRFAISSYSSFSSTGAVDFVRWRYTFAARSQNVNSSRFSFGSYISFNYRSTEWNHIKNNINDALKIYSLAVNYSINSKWDLTLGRKINSNLTNIGAVDGLQLQGKFGKVSSGIVVGSRPDYKNYSYNFSLFELGGFVSYADKAGFGIMQNSLALFQQTNDFKTDRRFFYFQHSSNFIKPVSFFFSTEVDLYKKENGVSSSDFSLTGMYASLRYKPIRELSFSGSFDSRKNVIYYETYQNYTDSLYENATRQGFNFRINLRPWNNLYLRFSYGNRYRTGDFNSSENYSGNISYARIPLIRGTFSVNYNNLATSYLDGNIIGLSYSRDLFSGLLFTTLHFRKIYYEFLNGSPNLNQNILSVDISWRIIRYLSASLAYEGTFEKEYSYGRIFFNITKRF